MIRSRHGRLIALAASAVLVFAAGAGPVAPATAESLPAPAHVQTKPSSKAKPTVVLVHGAFADSSGWSKVASALMAKGYPVIAFSNPLRGVQYDSEYLRAFLGTLTGKIVLVGHSYGGAVITNAATGNPNVKSLVYVAAYALAEGETVAAANSLGGGHTEIANHLVIRPFPGAAEGDADAFIDPAFLPSIFAQDLPKREARFLAVSQRPAALATLGTPSGPPAWKEIPSWYLVARQDRTIPPEAERAMAARAGSTTTEINSSHVPMISHPRKVLHLIEAAAR